MNGERKRVTQLDSVQRERDFETLNPKWAICIESFISGLGTRAGATDSTKETESCRLGWAYELPETGAACTGPARGQASLGPRSWGVTTSSALTPNQEAISK